MKNLIKIVCFPFDMVFIILVMIYKKCISPLKPKCCKFVPTCSSYMIYSIREYHFYKGIFIGLKRILKCNHKSKGGQDFVVPNLKGDSKWLF